MKRQLKFRVWDFFKKRWVKSWVDHCSQSIAFLPEESNDGKHNVEFFDTFDGSEFILQQYTGLKDKNDKDIYEGDIVKATSDQYENENFVGKVIFDGGCFLIWIHKNDIRGVWSGDDIEVIGNIFENIFI